MSRSSPVLVSRCLALALVIALSACGGGGGGGGATGGGGGGGGITNPPTGPVATNAVTMNGSAFTPPAIVVTPGTTVTFTNNDGIDHNVTFGSAGIASSGSFSSGTRSITMPTTPGTYNYQCTLHPGMNGSVKVE